MQDKEWLNVECILQVREDRGPVGAFLSEVATHYQDKHFMKQNLERILQEFNNAKNSMRTRLMMARCYITYFSLITCASEHFKRVKEALLGSQCHFGVGPRGYGSFRVSLAIF